MSTKSERARMDETMTENMREVSADDLMGVPGGNFLTNLIAVVLASPKREIEVNSFSFTAITTGIA